MLSTWVVVADSSRARFFSLVSRTESMQELDGMVHVESRMRELDEVSDRQGGIAGGHGEGDHTFEAPTDFKHHEAQLFAKQIGVKLERGRVNNEYAKLILIAPPAFLGVLRESLNSHVSDLVIKSMHKNLVVEDESVIREHIHND
ncbi:host attachment protein [Methylicorpusculum oleiharenae]|uniref:host attachment protein n=1 Tax=Methylicorpusculum oleiharenae TaxID=1338687 RepID=UPI00135A6AC2|nr:host attachment protein [Methylicorpusculum oleiharenae]MCD2450937.1 host attachment protein [Methylicorpusculum oleiharenae]